MLGLAKSRRSICAQCAFALRQSRTRRRVHQSTTRRKEGEESVWQERATKIRAGEQQSMLTILEERGLVNKIAGNRDDFDKLLTSKRVGAYVGVDPTAPSLHVGHLVPLMALFWMYIHGYRTNTLLGSATARIGDPTDRLTTRDQISSTDRKVMTVAMHWQLKSLWVNLEAYSRKYGYKQDISHVRGLYNNNMWLNKLPLMDVLRDMGPAFRVGWMLSRDSVKMKMEKGDGVSLPEFFYPVLQAWDWWHMFKTQNIQIQIGGSDQMGNIVTGIDAVKWAAKNQTRIEDRIDFDESPDMIPYGFTTPLLTSSAGEKFGKSAGNAIWLDRGKTSSFELYQFFLRTPDSEVARYLKLFTFMPIQAISELIAQHEENPPRRVAQHRLAKDILEMVHGPVEAEEAEAQHRLLFSNSKNRLPADQDAAKSGTGHKGQINSMNLPASMETILPESLVRNVSIIKVLKSAGLVVSSTEGHRVVTRGGAYIGSKSDGSGNMGDDLTFTPIKNFTPDKTWDYVMDDSLMILRVGKWKVKIVRIISDDDFRKRGLDCPGWMTEEKERAAKDSSDFCK